MSALHQTVPPLTCNYNITKINLIIYIILPKFSWPPVCFHPMPLSLLVFDCLGVFKASMYYTSVNSKEVPIANHHSSRYEQSSSAAAENVKQNVEKSFYYF